MPEAAEGGAAAAERGGPRSADLGWALGVPTQAHIRAEGSAAGAAGLALRDATAALGSAAAGGADRWGGGDADLARLAKLHADLLRVEATLPRAALAEAWDAPAWRQVSACRHCWRRSWTTSHGIDSTEEAVTGSMLWKLCMRMPCSC